MVHDVNVYQVTRTYYVMCTDYTNAVPRTQFNSKGTSILIELKVLILR